MSSRHSGHSNKLLAKIEYAGYIYKRNNWIVDPRWLRSDCFQEEFSLNSPVFLLGTQGGGLTLVSRMLRRNREVVSVTGNNGYWSGADEMQAVLRQNPSRYDASARYNWQQDAESGNGLDVRV